MQVTLANWRSSPFNRWSVHHVRELIPSADIANDPGHIREFAVDKRSIDVRIDPDSGEALDLEAFLRATDTDGMAIVHRGKLVFEHYANGMTPETPHILMSVSKSLLGLLVEKLRLDTGREVSEIIPEMRGTAYSGASLSLLIDMRAGIDWDKHYHQPAY